VLKTCFFRDWSAVRLAQLTPFRSSRKKESD
jgi:hypothetical protein